MGMFLSFSKISQAESIVISAIDTGLPGRTGVARSVARIPSTPTPTTGDGYWIPTATGY